MKFILLINVKMPTIIGVLCLIVCFFVLNMLSAFTLVAYSIVHFTARFYSKTNTMNPNQTGSSLDWVHIVCYLRK